MTPVPKDRHGHIEGPPGDSRLESTFTFEDCQRDAGGTATDVVVKLWLCQDVKSQRLKDIIFIVVPSNFIGLQVHAGHKLLRFSDME